MANKRKPSTDSSRESVAIRNLVAGMRAFEKWAEANELPENATAFDAMAKYEGWSEETIQRKKVLLEIETLLGDCVSKIEKVKALHHAAKALGLEPEHHLPPETEGPKKAEAMRIAGWMLWWWRKNYQKPPREGQTEIRLARERQEAESLIGMLGELWPRFLQLQRADVLMRLRRVNGKTSPHSFLRELADLVGMWPDQDKESLKKARQRES